MSSNDDNGDGEAFDEAVGNMLGERFNGDKAGKANIETDNERMTPEQSSESRDDSGGKSDVEVPADVPVREWTQYTMLLPPDIARALNKRFKRLNAERTLNGNDELAKNEDYNLALARYVLAEMDEDDIEQYAGR